MSLDTDLQSKLASLTTAPVQQNYAHMAMVQPRVWYQREFEESPPLLSGIESGIREVRYTIEVNALDPDEGYAIAVEIQNRMQTFRGVMYGTLILGVFVEAASDDYVPRGLDLDDGFHVFVFTLRILL